MGVLELSSVSRLFSVPIVGSHYRNKLSLYRAVVTCKVTTKHSLLFSSFYFFDYVLLIVYRLTVGGINPVSPVYLARYYKEAARSIAALRLLVSLL